MEQKNRISRLHSNVKTVFGRLKTNVVETAKMGKKIGKEDPRKVIHSMKAGLALTLVSLFYYFRPLYNGFGESGMWAILTVVVVFEFTVGGTLSKSLNRGAATMVAGALGLGAESLAGLCGEIGEPIVLGLFVFLIAMASTFTRFFPDVKSRYDYGVLIFILTFSLVAVSGFRVTQIIQLARQRVATILIGGAVCMIISVFICPVWAGQDLHNLLAANIEKLAVFLDGFGDHFFCFPGDEGTILSSKIDNKSFLLGYKSVLNSRMIEESLANFAWWEPGHGRFTFHHPWNQYLKIGILAKECATQIDVLARFLNSKSQLQVASGFHRKIRKPCTTLSTESSKALRELSHSLKNMRFPSSAVQIHIRNSKSAANYLKTTLENSSLPHKQNLQEIMQLIVISSVLTDIIKCVEEISVSVHELSRMARFRDQKSTSTLDKEQKLFRRGNVNVADDIGDGDDHAVIDIHGAYSKDTSAKNILLPLEREQQFRVYIE